MRPTPPIKGGLRAMNRYQRMSPGVVAIAAAAAALVAAVPRVSYAAPSTCNAALQIAYVSGPNNPNIGDTERVQLTLGAGTIQNGTTFTLNRVRFDLDCTNTSTGQVPCTDDGLVIGYNGDTTISTTCGGVTWASGHATSGSPNEVVFDASPDIVIPAGS